ncbi:MAG: aminopeptidase P family protein [Dehalococcoidia bacterium]|nr:MAG: aminopeptidase P family protein [Dehalococcoidia bacterium]
MSTQADYEARLKKIQAKMDEQDIDVLIATRLSTVGYVFGAFVPWRGVAVIPREGEPQLYVLGLDSERVKDDSFFKNVTGVAPLPGMALWDQILSYLRTRGLEKGRIGVELGHSPIRIETFLLASEYELLREAFPQAIFKNATDSLNEIFIIKDEAEIECFRRAAEICDLGLGVVLKELKVGMTETEVAGIAEYAMRKAGSELNWTFTGGQEIGSGARTAYSWGGCTPPTRKRIEAGDNVLLDVHAMYNLYLGDLARNAIMGEPTPEQRELSEVFVAACNLLLESMKPGVTYGEVADKMDAFMDRTGYRQYALPGYGHGIGILGDEYYPVVINSSVPYESKGDLVLQPNMVEVAALVLNRPGVGGMRMEMTVLITKDGSEGLNKVPFEPAIIAI